MLPVLNGSVAGVGLSPNDGFNHNQLYIYFFRGEDTYIFKKILVFWKLVCTLYSIEPMLEIKKENYRNKMRKDKQKKKKQSRSRK